MPDDDRTRRRLSDATKGRIDDLASGWDKPKPAIASEKPGRGDETNARIADLASGWSVDGADTPEDSPAMPAPEPPTPGRKKPKTLPPPPPGSRERAALEAAIVESNTGPAPKSEPVSMRTTAPPPLPSKSGANAKAPSPLKVGPTETGTVNISGVIDTHGLTPAPVILKPHQVPGVGKVKTPLATEQLPPTSKVKTSLPTEQLTNKLPTKLPTPPATPKLALPLPPNPVAPPKPIAPPLARPPLAKLLPDESGEATEVDPNAHLTVPVGEFEQGGTFLEQDKLRIAYEQSTIKRDTASALLSIPEQPLTVVKAPPIETLLGESAAQITRGDPTTIDPSTSRFERGDPTTLGADSTGVQPNTDYAVSGKLRAQAALRRKRGIGGDVRYVVTVIFGVRRARRELTGLEHQQEIRQKSRARHLLTLGRGAIGSEGYDHPALNKARELLGVVEDERAQHAASVTAADSELMRVRTDRTDKAKAYAEAIAHSDAELTELAKKLEPLEKEVAASTKKAAELHEALRKIDGKIAAVEAGKVQVKKADRDPAEVQAELSALKADRIAITRDEPRIAAELDGLNPRIAALEARRGETRRRRAELDEEEKKDQGRAQELLAAIGAKRIVVDRASADAEAMRDKVLLELGERIYVDRPSTMQFELAPIDAIDVEMGTTDRRMMELREIIGSVDKAKLARGIAVIVFVLGGLGTLTWWLLHMLG